MLTTNDEAVYRELVSLRWMGIDRSTFARSTGTYQWEYDVREVGYKYLMNDITAAIGLAHLKRLEEWNERRRDIVALYRTELSDFVPHQIRFVEHTPEAVSANHLCTIRVRNRDAVVGALKKCEITVGVHYKPNHFYPPYAHTRRGDLTVTEQAYQELISLPLHLFLSDNDVRKVCQALRDILKRLPD